MARVYLETSFFSECVTIRTGAIDLGRRATSLSWWHAQVSPEIVRELSSNAFPAEVREPALSMLEGLEVMESTGDVLGVAQLLVQERVMPSPAVEGDALHVAFSIVHQVEFLLTWNQKHLANPRKRTHLMVICARLNLPTPQIVTPDLLIVEDTND